MVLLPHIKLLESCFQFHNYQSNKKLLNALYNSSTEVCLTKNYIELIEKEITNKDVFQSFITELSDESRLKLEKTTPKSSSDDEFLEIAQHAKIPLLLPAIVIDNKKYISIIPFLIIANEAKPINRHWIILELLSNNLCNVSYQDFKKDSEITSFFETVFSIPKYITSVYIFDRDHNTKLLSKLKGKKVEFYTLLKAGSYNEHLRKEVKKELRKNLGGSLKLYFTNNSGLLHERKIIFENIILTIDNSHNNLTIAEPTWEIIIAYDKFKSENWKLKCCKFSEVDN
jgi:hypothetical protein